MSTNHSESSAEVAKDGEALSSPRNSAQQKAGRTMGDIPSPQASTPPQADLEDAIPQITSHQLRRLNRHALTLLAGIVLLLALVAFWLFRSAGVAEQRTEVPNEETVTVPDAPVEPFAPPPAPHQPIELAPPARPAMAMPARAESLPATTGEATEPRKPTLLERRIAAAEAGAAASGSSIDAALQAGYKLPPTAGANGGTHSAAGAGGSAAPFYNSAYSAAKLPETSRATPLQHPDALMRRGTFIRCVLESRIITDMPGFTSCVVAEPIYSFTGKKLLLPKGSKIMGRYDMEPNGPRVAVIWDRIVTPNGIDVNMASPGVDTLSSAGHPGHYSAHWGSRIGAALLISMFSDAFKYEAAKHGPRRTTIGNGVVTQSPFESNTAEALQQLANEAVRRQANRPATVTIHQGTILSIHVARDVDFTDVLTR